MFYEFTLEATHCPFYNTLLVVQVSPIQCGRGLQGHSTRGQEALGAILEAGRRGCAAAGAVFHSATGESSEWVYVLLHASSSPFDAWDPCPCHFCLREPENFLTVQAAVN